MDIVDLISMYFLLDLLPWILTKLKSRHGYLRNTAVCPISNRIDVFKSKGLCIRQVGYIA